MALANATITYNLSDLGLVDFDYRRTKVWATTNIPGGAVIDTVGDQIRLGSAKGTLAADGTGSIIVPIPGTGSNPVTWQTTIHVDYPDGRSRAVRDFGPFTITASADLADLVPQQEIPPEYAGAIVAQMDALLAQAQAVVGGDLSAVYAPLRAFDVKKYGATGGGITDDRAAIQAAIDAANTAGGGVVTFPKGVYRIDTSLTPRSNVTLQGSGWGVSIIRPPATWASGSMLQVGGSTAAPIANFTVRHLEFDGSLVSSTVQCKALFVTYMTNLRFENNYVHDTTATGIGADFLDGGVIRSNVVRNCGRYATGLESTRLGCSGIGIGTGEWESEETLVEGNFVYNAVRFGIFVERQGGISDYHARHIKIINNHIESAYWGIGSNGVGFLQVRGNSVQSCTSHGIAIGPDNAGALSYADDIFDNVVVYNGGRGISIDAPSDGNQSPPMKGYMRIGRNRVAHNTSVGIKLTGAGTWESMSIFDNDVYLNGSLGIDIGAVTNGLDLCDNRVWNNTGQGIRFINNATKARVAGNRSYESRAAGRTQTHGIDLGGSAFTDCDFVDNDLQNNSSAAMAYSGTLTGCQIARNRGWGPDAVASVTVSASPMSVTVGPRPETYYVIGGTWTNIQIGGTTIHTGNLGTTTFAFDARPGDVLTFTYTVAPTAIKKRTH